MDKEFGDVRWDDGDDDDGFDAESDDFDDDEPFDGAN